jgi:hypothetical protein
MLPKELSRPFIPAGHHYDQTGLPRALPPPGIADRGVALVYIAAKDKLITLIPQVAFNSMARTSDHCRASTLSAAVAAMPGSRLKPRGYVRWIPSDVNSPR